MMSDLETGLYTVWAQYTSFAADINLTTDALSPSTHARPARCIKVLEEGAGTIALRFTNGDERSFDVTPDDIARGLGNFDATHVAAILSATDVGKVWVGW